MSLAWAPCDQRLHPPPPPPPPQTTTNCCLIGASDPDSDRNCLGTPPPPPPLQAATGARPPPGFPYGDNCVFVANDWHAGMVCNYVAARYRPHGVYNNARTILAIHNLMHQGCEPATTFGMLGMPDDWCGPRNPSRLEERPSQNLLSHTLYGGERERERGEREAFDRQQLQCGDREGEGAFHRGCSSNRALNCHTTVHHQVWRPRVGVPRAHARPRA